MYYHSLWDIFLLIKKYFYVRKTWKAQNALKDIAVIHAADKCWSNDKRPTLISYRLLA